MPEVDEVVATGTALLRDEEWLQIMSDALARPITASGVPEASLRVAAVWVLERIGVPVPPAPIGRMVEPRAAHPDAYRSVRERQRRLYRNATGTETS